MKLEEEIIEQAAKALNAGGHLSTCRFMACTCGAVDNFKSERLEFFRLLRTYIEKRMAGEESK